MSNKIEFEYTKKDFQGRDQVLSVHVGWNRSTRRKHKLSKKDTKQWSNLILSPTLEDLNILNYSLRNLHELYAPTSLT